MDPRVSDCTCSIHSSVRETNYARYFFLGRKMVTQPFGVNNCLDLVICSNSEDASNKGFVYDKRVFTSLEINKVVVVQKGTREGNPTVDFQLFDDDGRQYVTMVTGNLIRAIPCQPDVPIINSNLSCQPGFCNKCGHGPFSTLLPETIPTEQIPSPRWICMGCFGEDKRCTAKD